MSAIRAAKCSMKSHAGFELNGLLFKANERVAEWVNEHCGCARLPSGPYEAIGIVSGNDLIGGLIFFDEQENDILMAMALERPSAALRQRVANVMSYPFTQLNKPRVSAEIATNNHRCRKLAEGMGFVLEGIKRGAADDGSDLAVYGLLKEEFKLKDRI